MLHHINANNNISPHKDISSNIDYSKLETNNNNHIINKPKVPNKPTKPQSNSDKSIKPPPKPSKNLNSQSIKDKVQLFNNNNNQNANIFSSKVTNPVMSSTPTSPTKKFNKSPAKLKIVAQQDDNMIKSAPIITQTQDKQALNKNQINKTNLFEDMPNQKDSDLINTPTEDKKPSKTNPKIKKNPNTKHKQSNSDSKKNTSSIVFDISKSTIYSSDTDSTTENHYHINNNNEVSTYNLDSFEYSKHSIQDISIENNNTNNKFNLIKNKIDYNNSNIILSNKNALEGIPYNSIDTKDTTKDLSDTINEKDTMINKLQHELNELRTKTTHYEIELTNVKKQKSKWEEEYYKLANNKEANELYVLIKDMNNLADKLIVENQKKLDLEDKNTLLEQEMVELSQKLFEQANEMVSEESKKRHLAEKRLLTYLRKIEEAEMINVTQKEQIEQLKIVIENLSSKNCHLIRENDLLRKSLESQNNNEQKGGRSPLHNNNSFSEEKLEPVSMNIFECKFPISFNLDDIRLKDFENFIQTPELKRYNHTFFKRILSQDLENCLDFHNSSNNASSAISFGWGSNKKLFTHVYNGSLIISKLDKSKLKSVNNSNIKRTSESSSGSFGRFFGSFATAFDNSNNSTNNQKETNNPNTTLCCSLCNAEDNENFLIEYGYQYSIENSEMYAICGYCRARIIAACDFCYFAKNYLKVNNTNNNVIINYNSNNTSTNISNNNDYVSNINEVKQNDMLKRIYGEILRLKLNMYLASNGITIVGDDDQV